MSERVVCTVSELAMRIKASLEDQFPAVWVEGEISNLRTPSSGHAYFTLKDDTAQLRCVLFRGRGRRVAFQPEDGMQVLAFGGLDVYLARGEYQLVVELLEPKGVGALQLAFEQLKRRLEAEGLFDAARKRGLPPYPRTIGIVTSPTGAAIRDMLHVIDRRFADLRILITPVRVQGEEAPGEIVAALRDLQAVEDLDVIIVGRGGGSIEDLWAFNDERVARAIAGCRVPVISGVGHETDFTIADFVADPVGGRGAGGAREAPGGARPREPLRGAQAGDGEPPRARARAGGGARQAPRAHRRHARAPRSLPPGGRADLAPQAGGA